MRNKAFGLLAALAALVIGGCLDMTTVVHVAPDGSGVVEERLLIKKEVAEMMRSMGEAMGSDAQRPPDSPVLDPQELAQSAQAMGYGVRLLTVEPLETDKGLGYIARFAFEDINQLRLNQNPADRAHAQEGAAQAQEKEPIRFAFQSGPEPVLIIRPPKRRVSLADDGESTAAAPETPPAPMDDPESRDELMMMQQLLDGLRIKIMVETETEILETNATWRDGQRVTLMALDFSKLLADPVRLKTFADSGARSVEDAKALMQGIPGIEVDLAPEIRIRMAGAGGATSEQVQPIQ